MITHASTTTPSRTSFSVHVEMYSRGFAGRMSRSCVTRSGRRTGAPNRRARIRVAGSPRAREEEAGRHADERHQVAEELEEGEEQRGDGAERGHGIEHARRVEEPARPQ